MQPAAPWSVASIVSSSASPVVLSSSVAAQNSSVLRAPPASIDLCDTNSVQQPTTPDQQPSEQQPTAQAPTGNDQGMFVFRKQIEEVVLHATVVDEQQHLVTGLDRSAFTVYEQGQPQTITSFRREDVPVEMGIVVDNSGSMRDKREQIDQAVLNLVRASNPEDQVFVVNFGQRPYLDQDFTSNVNLLQAALHQVSAKGSTALYDAIVASAIHLENNSRLNKKVLLVITDGQDNMSQETLQEAARRLQQANGPTLYAIGLTGGWIAERGTRGSATVSCGNRRRRLLSGFAGPSG